MLPCDIIVDIKFYSKNEGGRKEPTPSNFFSSLFIIEDLKGDCRLLLKDIGSISPGEFKKNVPIKFLYINSVLPKLLEGKIFYLWGMGIIAEGRIIKVIARNEPN